MKNKRSLDASTSVQASHIDPVVLDRETYAFSHVFDQARQAHRVDLLMRLDELAFLPRIQAIKELQRLTSELRSLNSK